VGFFVGPLYAGWRAGGLEPVLGAAAWRRPVLELGILGVVVAAIFTWLADDERPAPASERKTVPAGKLFPIVVQGLVDFIELASKPIARRPYLRGHVFGTGIGEDISVQPVQFAERDPQIADPLVELGGQR